MMLECKIDKTNFNAIKNGSKTVEIRELEGIKFNCGKQSIIKKINGFRLLKSGLISETDIRMDLRRAFPYYFTGDNYNPIVFIYLADEEDFISRILGEED